MDDIPNLALNKRATASSEAFKTDTKYYQTHDFVANNAVDRDPMTRWASKIFVRSPEWFQVDPGQVQKFNEICIGWVYWAAKYTVKVSDDGENLRKIADESQANREESTRPHMDTISLQKAENARYIRISMAGRPDKSGAKDRMRFHSGKSESI